MALQDRKQRTMEETSRKIKKRVDSLVSTISGAKEAREALNYMSSTRLGKQMREFVLRRTDIQSEGLQETLQYLVAFLNGFTGEQRYELMEAMQAYGLDVSIAEYADLNLEMQVDNKVGGKWSTDNIPEHVDFMREHGVNYNKFKGKGNLHRTIGYVVETAKESININCGDADFITGRAIEPGMKKAKEWQKIYTDVVENGVKLKVIMNVMAWNMQNVEEMVETGAEIRHNHNDIRAGSADGKVMYAFTRGATDTDYTKVVGRAQVQLDRMFYAGFLTLSEPMVKVYDQDFDELWENSVELERRLEILEKGANF